MSEIASQITSLTIVYSIVYSDADQRKHQSSASLAFVRGIHPGPVNSPHKWPVTRKMFPFDDVIMGVQSTWLSGPWRCGCNLKSVIFIPRVDRYRKHFLLNCLATKTHWRLVNIDSGNGSMFFFVLFYFKYIDTGLKPFSTKTALSDNHFIHTHRHNTITWQLLHTQISWGKFIFNHTRHNKTHQNHRKSVFRYLEWKLSGIEPWLEPMIWNQRTSYRRGEKLKYWDSCKICQYLLSIYL